MAYDIRQAAPPTLALAAAWFAAGLLAVRIFPAEMGLAAVWPASGVALGALLLRGLSLWPGIAIGSLALGAWSGLTATENLALTAGNVLEAVAGTWLAVKAAGGHLRMATLRGVLSFVGPGVIAGTGAGALVCVLLMEAGGRQTAAVLDLQPWAAWLGNAMGALLVAPVVLTWGRSCGRWTFPGRPLESAALAAATVAASAFVFSRMPVSLAANPVPYLLFPLFFWAAIRFGMREVTGLLLVAGTAAVTATCHALGPFNAGSSAENLVSLYLFLSVAIAPTLVLSAVIGERGAAEARLAENERNYRLVVENQTELVVRIDADGRVAYASPSLLEFLGRPGDDVIGRPLDLPVHEDDRAAMATAIGDLGGPSGESRAEVRLLGREGPCWFAWSGRREPAGGGAVLVGRDVTARRRAEAQARDHLEQLAHVSRVSSMGEMASAIAHEVNQPLTAIQTFADASLRMLRSGQSGPDAVEGALERIAGEADRAGEIIRRTRRFVRNEPGLSARIDLDHAVADVIRLASQDAQESGVALRAETRSAPARVVADPIQVQQVLLNLVRNAIEAIGSAEAPGERLVTLETSVRNGQAEVAVIDTGPGFADSDRVFEPFFTTKAEGLGIGLAISRSLVEANGGCLVAESAPGQGATFRVRFPAIST